MNNIDDLKNACETETGPYLRPFVTNRNWNKAQVFVIGTNPATPLRDEFDSFEDYWNSLTKEPARFEEIYSAQHTSGASKSTRRSRFLLEQLQPLNVLVTNAMIYPAKRPKYIPNKAYQRTIGIGSFMFLSSVCKPRAILFYGSEAIRLCRTALGIDLDPYQPISLQNATASWQWETNLFGFPHFSGQGVKAGYKVSEMNNELEFLARRIKSMLGSN